MLGKQRKVGMAVMLLSLVSMSCLGALDGAFARYRVILDRRPFGFVPPNKKIVAPPPPPPSLSRDDSFVRKLRLCAITEEDNGIIRVGIINIGVKPARSYLMRIGQIEDGFELMDADFEKEAALLRKDGKEEWLYMNGVEAPTASVGPPSPGGSSVPRPRGGRPVGRVRTARDVRVRRPAPEQKYRGEELKKHLEEYQMELIRSGGEKGPPLPMPLTQEMDDELVREGVLPPAE